VHLDHAAVHASSWDGLRNGSTGVRGLPRPQRSEWGARVTFAGTARALRPCPDPVAHRSVNTSEFQAEDDVAVFGRVPVARRNILADRRRLFIAVAGIGVALGLIFLLEGLWQGFQVQISAYEDNVGADLFVGQAGVHNFLGDTSVIPKSAAEQVQAIPSVDSADPITARFVILDLHGRKQFTFLIAAEQGRIGGPWRLAAGRRVAEADEAVIDRTLADQHGVAVGERIDIAGRPFEVVGLSEQTRSWMSSFVFVSPTAAETLLRSAGTASYLLVNAADPEMTARLIETRTGLTALPAATLAENDRVQLSKVFGEPINLMVGVAFVAGTIIVALTVYSAIVERIREYGIAKAMGARWARLFGIVLGQTLVLAALGTVAGFLVYLGAYRLVALVRPQFWVHLTPSTVLLVIAAAALMALLAAVIPTRRVARLDPASVYRG
jgi:putative ABC transport system permease protein